MKKAVITGATKGIGRAVAKALAEASYSLAVCARTASDLQGLRAELLDINDTIEVLHMPVDVGHRKEVDAFATMILGRWDHVDVLVNNAGLFIPGKITEEPAGVLEEMINVNLMSAYHLTRLLMPAVRASSAADIFNICSIASIQAYPNGGSYAISKFGLLGMTRCLREELKQEDIRVTAIIPGATYTHSWAGVDLPRSRFMQARDIAGAVMSALRMSRSTVVEEIVMRPQLGDL